MRRYAEFLLERGWYLTAHFRRAIQASRFRMPKIVMASIMVAAIPQAGSAGTRTPELLVTGPVQTIYRWTTDRCDDEHLPDAPARAFRRADGRVALLATHRENWLLLGDTLENLRSECRTVLSTNSLKAQGGAGEHWIQAVYTTNGRQIHALVSQDFSKETRRKGCRPNGLAGQCWFNSIASATSDDMGETFALGPTVAALGNEYPNGQTGRFGFFTTSNIAKGPDGKNYMIAFTDSRKARGNCLFQTEDPTNPLRWRAWGGLRFDVDLTLFSAAASCVPIGVGVFQNEIRSLLWSPAHRLWFVVTTARLKMPGDEAPVPGFYASTSPDLFTWSPLQRIMKAPTRPREEQMQYFVSYPSLIDSGSRSLIFDTIEAGSLWLFFTWHHLRNGQGTFNRDLVAVPLRLQPCAIQNYHQGIILRTS